MVREAVWQNAIKDFKRMCSPFEADELSKMNVTLDECGELSDAIGFAMELFSYVQKDPVLLSSIIIGMEWKNADFDKLYTFLSNHEQARKLMKRLKESHVG